MVSAKGIYHKNANTHKLLERCDDGPTGIQLFGNEPEILAKAARGLGKAFDLIDINMGCPAPKIVKNGEGSALMKNPKLIEEIVKAVAGTAEVPVTVKIRKGFDESNINAVEVALIAEANGAAAVTVHGRTRAQMFGGAADRGIIAEVKRAVKIPVIGNGDITAPEEARRMLDETGCDAVMVGRAAIGAPWVFGRFNHYIEYGELLPEPSAGERVGIALEHLLLAVERKGERVAVREMKQDLCRYIKGLNGAGEARVRINNAVSVGEMVEVLTLGL
jgi:nifR3 family TIM-barrel protein